MISTSKNANHGCHTLSCIKEVVGISCADKQLFQRSARVMLVVRGQKHILRVQQSKHYLLILRVVEKELFTLFAWLFRVGRE